MYDYWIAVVQGIIEGLTEFLPVSSTGHLILAGELMQFTGDKAETFEVIIQLGAILAVVILYWGRFMQLLGWSKAGRKAGRSLNLLHIIAAIVPALILGLLLHSVIKDYLFSPYTVLIGLVIGGLFMIFAEKRRMPVRTSNLDQLTYRQAFSIGLFQCLALWPGFSRSGATIAGGLLVGANHKTAADFSFLIAVPMMVAASGYDMLKSYQNLSSDDLLFFATGFVVSFIVALLAIVSFLKLLEKWKLTAFAYYRFVVAALFWLFLLH
ncbi:undecaprenyl-diphosphate phosphatase [Brevibacillus fulvus]|uniref:Undecaprenyl-diphosphatase n=1 Tax=Brevibacillus fulvus TaxID=1125967 RepID=A0A938XXA4_9BACL|nr:undecaprenyl-diphosphate phosphatase [Brevibacillus fulvus]MBM7589348.1 undecaprenyl-diphosphatase [Brevibacillus fulvus]